jgi:hypothetical protein
MFDDAVEDERSESRKRHRARGDDVRCEGCEHGCGPVSSNGRLHCTRARRLQCNGPPQQVINHRLRGHLEVRESLIHVAALKVREQRRHRDMNRRAHWRELHFYRGFAQLLDTACACDRTVAHERRGLAVPLRIHPVDCVLEHRGGP